MGILKFQDVRAWECAREDTVPGWTPMTAVARFTLEPTGNCTVDTGEYATGEYFASPSSTWQQAEDYCVANGGHLVSIGSYAEHALSKSSSRASVIARCMYDEGKSGFRLIDELK